MPTYFAFGSAVQDGMSFKELFFVKWNCLGSFVEAL